MSWSYKNQAGFTLVETVLALGLAAILATSATPVFIDINQSARRQAEEGVVGHVQTGVTLQQLQTLAMSGGSAYPQTLDSAPAGVLASGSNPFFNTVLLHPVTTGWSKVDANVYRSPTNQLYTYNPNNGTFASNAGTSTAVGGQNSGGSQALGNLVYQYAGVAFYDSGAIIDTDSKLAYIPSPDGSTVTLTLTSGTKIKTNDDGSALITLAGGETLNVADTHKANFYKLPPSATGPNDYSSDYLWVQGGYASENHYSVTYHKKEFQAAEAGGSFHYVYENDGDYSGGSLKKDFGMIYRTTFNSQAPMESKGSWSKDEKGNYKGSISHTYNYDSSSRMGYNHPEANYRYAFDQQGKTKGHSESEYENDEEKKKYKNKTKGRHEYEMESVATFGDRKVKVGYEYEGDSLYDKKEEIHESNYRYQYDDGKDLSYKYRYEQKSGIYEWEVTDNKSGKKTTQSNRKEKEKEVKKNN